MYIYNLDLASDNVMFFVFFSFTRYRSIGVVIHFILMAVWYDYMTIYDIDSLRELYWHMMTIM